MENPVRKAAEVSSGRNDDDGMPADLLMIRSVLQSMPKMSCPVGFEFRLQRRIEGLSVTPQRAAGGKSWVLGWTGAGLGFAAASVIAVVMFNFGFGVPNADCAGNRVNISANHGSGDATGSGKESAGTASVCAVDGVGEWTIGTGQAGTGNQGQ